MIKISKGLNVPISGTPVQKIFPSQPLSSVGILGDDYKGMKPTMLVQVGDKVKKGQVVFEDKKTPGVRFTSPVSGTVKEINRGERRVFQSIVFSVEGDDQVEFKSHLNQALNDYTRDQVKELLNESGLWTTLRTRPFSKTPKLDSHASSLFINAMDTQPLAPNPEVILGESLEDFKNGVLVLSKLAPKTFVVTASKSCVDVTGLTGVKHETFQGPHPAGNVGTHIHYLDAVSANKEVWHVGYQDVITIGKLFKTGQFDNSKVVSIAGPSARNPRLVRMTRGGSVDELLAGEHFDSAQVRHVSGSVLSGRVAKGVEAYVGQFHNQLTMLKEGFHREFLGWHSPGLNKFSLKNVFVSKLIPKKIFNFDTNLNGSHRSIVPIGSFESVMPMDILPTQLLRFLMAKHTDYAVNLGALELDEEDLALCTFVDPCKNEYGSILRENLNIIEKEG
jgi:Na+-transporting NADH:ubiquinone oxidoreductase subunit A